MSTDRMAMKLLFDDKIALKLINFGSLESAGAEEKNETLQPPKRKTIEELPLADHKVTLYVCGITPYDTTHLGHAFTYYRLDRSFVTSS